LSLSGVDMQDGKSMASDPMFLMEQMELREQLAGARAAPDPYAVISAIMLRLKSERNGLIEALSGQLADPTADNLAAARENVNKMQFLAKLASEAENLEAELDDEAY
jgi:molecular chaperone HscB